MDYKNNNSNISIKRTTRDDVELFREVRLKALKDSPDSFGQKYEEEIVKPLHYWQDLVDKVSPSSKNVAFLLFDTNKPIGIIFGFDKESQKGSFGGMWIDPDYRKQGLASKLVEKILDWAKGRGLKKMKLWNVDGNEAAEKLYRKYGFQPTGKQKPLESNPKFRISEFELIL